LNSGDKFNLSLLSDGSFDLSGGNQWTFLEAASFAGLTLTQDQDITSLFNITASGFNGGTDASGIKVVVGSTANGFTSLNIQASAVPEPATSSLMVFGLGGLVLMRSLRRKQS